MNQVLLATDSLSQVITGDEKSELQEEHIVFVHHHYHLIKL